MGWGRGMWRTGHSQKPHTLLREVCIEAFLGTFYSDLSYTSMNILLSHQLVRKRTEEWIRRKWGLLTEPDRRPLVWRWRKGPNLSIHPPAAQRGAHTFHNVSTTQGRGIIFKSKIAEVCANHSGASRRHLILLPILSQKSRKAFALF